MPFLLIVDISSTIAGLLGVRVVCFLNIDGPNLQLSHDGA
jgi:hypothetical protein